MVGENDFWPEYSPLIATQYKANNNKEGGFGKPSANLFANHTKKVKKLIVCMHRKI